MTQVVMHLGEGSMDEASMDLPRRRIASQVHQKGGLQDQERPMSYSDPSKVKRVATKYVQKGMHLVTMRSRGLTLERCYNAVRRWYIHCSTGTKRRGNKLSLLE